MNAPLLAALWTAFLRWAFWLLYNPLSWTYDGVSRIVSFGQWRQWQRAALPLVRGPDVLELACGTGNLLADLAGEGFAAVGLDLSPWMVDHARHRLAARGREAGLVRGRAQRLPFADRSFDSIVVTFPTAFILEPGVIGEAARILRPGGRLVVVIMAQIVGSAPLHRFVEWLYQITYQRGPMPDVQRLLAPHGLQGEIRRAPVGQSVVWLLEAGFDV